MKNQGPNILLISPPPIGKMNYYAEEFTGGQEKSLHLVDQYRLISAELGCELIDAGVEITSSKKDGIHWDSISHKKIAEVIANKVISMQNIFMI